jgi:hypothetical protein
LEHLIPVKTDVPAETMPPSLVRKEDLDLMVVKKVVELYGGIVDTQPENTGVSRTRILFRLEPPAKL